MCLQGGSIAKQCLSLHNQEIVIANSVVDTGEMPNFYNSNNKHNLAHFAPMVVGTVADGQLVRL